MIRNYLSIDVEDYFHVAAFAEVVAIERWASYQSRVERNTEATLNQLARHGVKATFFILGWVAEHFPELVRQIHRQGHEIGCHSLLHRKVYTLTPGEFREDTRKAKELLEEIIGEAVVGYRAPSYSITRKSLWALDILEELGFRYDSSIFPVYHDNYGIPDARRFEHMLPGKALKEYPISTVRLLGKNIPVSGGGYFRLFPYWFTRRCLNSINSKEKKPFMFYLHPWELDPEQPRIEGAGPRSRFRHYLHLSRTGDRLNRLLADFSFGPING